MRNMPELLAPAGDSACFLAALAAGADAVYVGLKHFSARAGADNFSLTELSRMVELARRENSKVYIAFNSLVKPDEINKAGHLMQRLGREVKPQALIIQDPGLIEIARQAGYEGELHLSTLANLTSASALRSAAQLGASRVILPRELSIDEIRQVAEAAPDGLDLELFIQGALCWCVSGRCYWSSYMGGKSGLRGRCVQPCRRVYKQNSKQARFFSCQDLSIGVLIKTLLDVPRLNCLKIEGRKKGPHYVYYVVRAYKTLLEAWAAGEPDAAAKKESEALLQMALGRPGTKALFLPQRPQQVAALDQFSSSGLLIGRVQYPQAAKPAPAKGKARVKQPEQPILPQIKPFQELLPKDLLRIGFEDENWHDTIPVFRRVPKAGTLHLKLARHKTPPSGTPVFLIDRKEKELTDLLQTWQARLDKTPAARPGNSVFQAELPKAQPAGKLPNITVLPSLPQGKASKSGRGQALGLWLSPNSAKAISRTLAPRLSWWLPPVIWPSEERMLQSAVNQVLRSGGRQFVCNAPWQRAMFPDELNELNLIAGPFCNLANAAALAVMRKLGFGAAIVSPELGRDDYLELAHNTPLPLGIILDGYWPVGISRHKPEGIKPNEPFASPRNEVFWSRIYGQNLWLYPAWPLDLHAHKTELQKAGYSFFVSLQENLPDNLPARKRPGEFNWELGII